MSTFALIIVVVGISFVTGALSATVANLKGHSASGWFFAGFFFSILGLLATVGLPDRKPQG